MPENRPSTRHRELIGVRVAEVVRMRIVSAAERTERRQTIVVVESHGGNSGALAPNLRTAAIVHPQTLSWLYEVVGSRTPRRAGSEGVSSVAEPARSTRARRAERPDQTTDSCHRIPLRPFRDDRWCGVIFSAWCLARPERHPVRDRQYAPARGGERNAALAR